MGRVQTLSIHRAVLLSSLAATAAFFAVPAAMAVFAALGSSRAGLTVAFVGFVAVAVGPWVFLGAYLGTSLVAYALRTVGSPIVGRSLRAYQVMGLGLAASLTLLGSLLTSEVQYLWLVFTLPAGVVGGSVFHRSLLV